MVQSTRVDLRRIPLRAIVPMASCFQHLAFLRDEMMAAAPRLVIASGHLRRTPPRVFSGFLIDPDVDLAPNLAFGAAMFVGSSFVLDLDACAVDQRVQDAVRPS